MNDIGFRVLVFTLCWFVCQGSPESALTTFFAETNGQNWRRNDGWGNSSIPYCSWYGVGCDSTGGKVVSLDLVHNHLAGSPSWSGLTDLVVINVTHNNLTGALPTAASTGWSNVQVLKLDINNFEGGLPADWASWSDTLRFVSVANNYLTGTLPDGWSAWQAIQTIDVSGNKIAGVLPTSWASWGPSLQALRLSDNVIGGGLPTEWVAWTNINEIRLDNNNLEGTLPAAWGNLTTLNTLVFFNNQLEGSLPTSWSALRKLTTLYLYNNKLSGSLPTEWSGMKSLVNFSVYNNILDGGLPDRWSNLFSIETFNLRNNQLNGFLPPSWSAWSNLSFFDVHNNNIQGTLPEAWSALTQLSTIDVSYNSIRGRLPVSWLSSLWSQLDYISLRNNELDSELPPNWGVCSNVSTIILSGNLISGTLPPEWGQLSNLRSLDVSQNFITGTIPSSWSNMTHLESLFMSRNVLSGTLPTELLQLPRLGQFSISRNFFSGSVPETNFTKNNLTHVDMSSNNLNGTLPECWLSRAESGLYADFSGNQLSGTLPAVNMTKQIEMLDVSYNSINGSIPSGLWVEMLRVSNNVLSGSIPVDLFQKSTFLDFSYNQLDGTLPVGPWSPQLSVVSIAGNPVQGEVVNVTGSTLTYLDVTSTSPLMQPLDQITGITETTPFLARNPQFTPSCDMGDSSKSMLDKAHCFFTLFTLMPSPVIVLRQPSIVADSFSPPLRLQFLNRVYSKQLFDLATTNYHTYNEAHDFPFSTNPYTVDQGELENFLLDRYVVRVLPKLVCLDCASNNYSFSNPGNANRISPISVTPGLILGGPLPQGSMTIPWEGVILPYGIAFRIDYNVTVSDRYKERSQSLWDPIVRYIGLYQSFGTFQTVIKSDQFYRSPCSISTSMAVFNDTYCVECPTNAKCDGSTVFNTTEMVWRPSTNVLPLTWCDAGNYGCMVGADGTKCNRGYTGPLCALCQPGYGKWANSCHECPSDGLQTFIVVLLGAFELAYTTWVVRCAIWINNDQENFSKKRTMRQTCYKKFKMLLAKTDVPLKMFFNHMAIMGLVASTFFARRLQAETIHNMLSLQYLIGNVAVYDVLGVNCKFRTWSQVGKFQAALGVCLFVIVLELAVGFTISKFRYFKERTTWRSSTFLPALSILVCILRILHPTIIAYSASIIPCMTYNFYDIASWYRSPVGPKSDANEIISLKLLSNDRSTDCRQIEGWRIVAWFVLFVVGIGIPVAFIMLFKKVFRDHDPKVATKTFGFLVQNFTIRCCSASSSSSFSPSPRSNSWR